MTITRYTKQLSLFLNLVIGVWLIDRGGDREKIFSYLLERKKDFIIRLKRGRHLIAGKYFTKKQDVLKLAYSCAIEEECSIKYPKEGKDKILHLRYGI